MKAAEALVVIRGYAQANRITFTTHALEEMTAARAAKEDVQNALAKGTDCRAGNAVDRWKVQGPDRDGDSLDVVVIIEDGLLIVTVM